MAIQAELLMVLLMDQVTERDIGCHTMTRRKRERPAKWHEWSLTVTIGQDPFYGS